jgi:hypothetical protein
MCIRDSICILPQLQRKNGFNLIIVFLR